MNDNQKVGLGCGTLILIALIVLIFGNLESEKSSQDIKAIRREVSRLENSVRRLQTTLGKQSKQLADIQLLLKEDPPTSN